MNDAPTTQKVSLEITWKSVLRILLGGLLAISINLAFAENLADLRQLHRAFRPPPAQ